MKELTEDLGALILIIHQIKQFLYGFEVMNEISNKISVGSPRQAFYMNSVYNYLSIFFLLDKSDNRMGGSIYKELKR